MNRIFGLILLLLAFSPVSANTETEAEIRQLIDAVAQSPCQFERNGKVYEPADAASHLDLKYRKGKRYAKTAENFIDRLASESSFSGKPYYILCPETERQTAHDWFYQELTEIRKG